MAKTTKQIADEMGVSKQKVYRYIKKNCICEAHQENGVMYYDETAETLIKQGFSENEAHHEAHHEAHQNHINEAVIELLRNELQAKNEQIGKLQKLLDQEQQLRMVSEQKLLLLEEKQEEPESTKKRWQFWK
jgi:predicted DNA-binding transcriptional regulator YafY